MLFHRRLPTMIALGAVLFLALVALGMVPGRIVERTHAAGETGPIAYVRGDTQDEIRLIEPDGSRDRLLWAHGQADPQQVHGIWSLDWRPDGQEIAFSSTHENACSVFYVDIYAVQVDGQRYRRISFPPACDQLASYPQGTVRVPVTNSGIGGSLTLFLYFIGAPGVQQVSLPPGGSTVVTFENVADFGDEVLQAAVLIEGANREISFASAVDVRADQTVESATIDLYHPFSTWEARSPTWRSDGLRLGYVLNFNQLMQIEPSPPPLELGESLVEEGQMPDFVDILAWGPAPVANQLLYVGNDAFESEAIYRVTEDNPAPGEALLTYEPYENVLGLAWLPDGSGFLYAVQESEFFEPVQANIYEYRFSDGRVTQLTHLTNEYAGRLDVSPDGQQVVFERAARVEELGDSLLEPDLW
ncbi:MAG: hypothetical protein M3220_19590, partial [Chloroflexota bacterium]|nr:hypothetical protein [Chloroflexota bacterium]